MPCSSLSLGQCDCTFLTRITAGTAKPKLFYRLFHHLIEGVTLLTLCDLQNVTASAPVTGRWRRTDDRKMKTNV